MSKVTATRCLGEWVQTVEERYHIPGPKSVDILYAANLLVETWDDANDTQRILIEDAWDGTIGVDADCGKAARKFAQKISNFVYLGEELE